MAIISFDFSGWCRADITKAFDKYGKEEVDVSNMPANELADKLNKGELLINFASVYADQSNGENQITGFTPVEDEEQEDDTVF
jgi:hypothetical protein